jgi:hypothetical protein
MSGKTTDPVESLLSLLEKGELCSNIAESFYGGASTYCHAIVSPGGPKIFAKHNAISQILDDPEYALDEACRKRWEWMKALACLVAGKSPSLKEIVRLFPSHGTKRTKTAGPTPAEHKSLEDYTAKFGLPSLRDEKAWTEAHWQVVDFLIDANDAKEGPASQVASPNQERLPILVADDDSRVGSVVMLVAELRLGPPIIRPDWWRMGLIPFDDDSFVTAIQEGMEKAWPNPAPHKRIRWWLEGAEKEWRYKLGDGKSAGLAAYCVARALFDKGPRPVVDESVAISAVLRGPSSSGDLWLEPVGSVTQKLRAAERAMLSAVVFKSGTEIDEQVDVIIGDVDNVDDAYDSVRVTPVAIAEHKAKIAAAWKEQWDEQPTPKEFRDASRTDA